jgi:type I restriction enzyme M protein
MSSNQRIDEIFSASDVKHGLSLFSLEEINAIERLVVEKAGKFFVTCQVKNKLKIAKPEEIVRQLWIYRLLAEYNYPLSRLDVERLVYFGFRDSGLADICVLHEDLTHPYIMFETKRPGNRTNIEFKNRTT